MRALISTIVLLAYAHVASAQSAAVCDGPDCAVGLAKGQLAPFAGQLLTDHLAITLGQKADNCPAQVKEAVDYAKKLDAADLAYVKQTSQIALDAKSDENARLQEALKAQGIPFYEKPIFVAGATTIVVVGVVLVAIKAIDAVNKK